MSTNHTSNYNLNQWVKSDRVLMSEFNADNAKIDAAVKAVDNRVTSLSSTVSGKASQSALNTLQSTVNSHTAALAGKGNCQIYVTSYTGAGECEEANANSLTFPAAPEVVYIGKGSSWLTLRQGDTFAYTMGQTGGIGPVTAAWSGKTVRWYSTNVRGQMNESGATYKVIALIKAD